MTPDLSPKITSPTGFPFSVGSFGLPFVQQKYQSCRHSFLSSIPHAQSVRKSYLLYLQTWPLLFLQSYHCSARCYQLTYCNSFLMISLLLSLPLFCYRPFSKHPREWFFRNVSQIMTLLSSQFPSGSCVLQWSALSTTSLTWFSASLPASVHTSHTSFLDVPQTREAELVVPLP